MLTDGGLAVRYGSLEEAHELVASLRAVYRPPILQVLTYAHVCERMLTYAHVCSRILTYAHVSSRMLTYAHVWRAAFLQGLEALRAGQGAGALQARPAQIRDVLQVRQMCIRQHTSAYVSIRQHT
jgi:hypothetical protein